MAGKMIVLMRFHAHGGSKVIEESRSCGKP